MNLVKLNGALGVRIEGLKLVDATAEDVATIKKAVAENCVVVVRDQMLGPEEHIAFGKKLGPLVHTAGSVAHNVKKASNSLQGYPEIFRVTNGGKGVNYTEHWHADNAHVEMPTSVSILAAQVLPECGGDTMFSNQYRAFARLSPALQNMLMGLRLKHTGARQPAFRALPWQEAPSFVHPVVQRHPETNRPALFIGGFNDPARPHFDGMSIEESKPLQDYLAAQSTLPDNCYRHIWSAGDVLLWDNRCALHMAIHDYGDQTREMNRVTITGSSPIAYQK